MTSNFKILHTKNNQRTYSYLTVNYRGNPQLNFNTMRLNLLCKHLNEANFFLCLFCSLIQ